MHMFRCGHILILTFLGQHAYVSMRLDVKNAMVAEFSFDDSLTFDDLW